MYIDDTYIQLQLMNIHGVCCIRVWIIVGAGIALAKRRTKRSKDDAYDRLPDLLLM